MTEPLDITRHGAGVELTLNRPACRNALSRELVGALTAALRAAEADGDVRTVTLTGTPPAFCAGLDLREMAETAGAATEHDTSALLELYETMDGLSKPVLAAVNGPAVAGGAGLVCLCDIVVFGASGQIGYPGIRHGLVAPIVMPYLLWLVGERRARYLLLTGEMLTASEAVEYGLANQVVPDDDLLPRVRDLAATLASHPPDALARTKSLLNRLRDARGTDRVTEIRRLAESVPLTDEARAGVNRFLDM